ncbi:neutral/alkaline non-lysosomal ceramidase N-terminal domain-containing protein [candidate division KSB1 bacterium]
MKGGCAKVNITPPVGYPLSGSAKRTKSSDSIADELYAKTIVLNDGQTTIAIICTDLLWVSLDMTNDIRKLIEEKTGIPGKNILVTASHTHYGPVLLKKITKDARRDNAYTETLLNKIAGAVLVAHKNMKTVKIGAVKGDVPEVSLNRRFKKPDGSIKMSWGTESRVVIPPKIKRKYNGSVKETVVIPFNDPELEFGPVDPEVGIIRMEDLNGEIIGSLVNYACHTSSAGSLPDLLYSISADYPTYIAEVVEQLEGGICLFALGTAANIVTIKRGGEFRKGVGTALGAEALRRLQFVSMSDNAELRSLTKSIVLPLKADRIKDGGKEYIESEIQVLKIGDIYILGLPGEIIVEIGLEIKNRAGIENLFIFTCSNDRIGYVCNSKEYDAGGYEATRASKVAKGSGEIIIKEALSLIKEIQESK